MAENFTGSEFLGGRGDDGINFPSPKDLSDAFLQPLTTPSIFDYYQPRGFSAADGEIIEQDDIRYRQEHEPYRFEPDGDMVVWITKAHLYEIHPRKPNNVIIHDLKELNIKVDPNCVVWSSWMTDTHGNVIPNADGNNYVLGKSEGDQVPISTNFIPENEEGSGSNGLYFIPLFWVKDGKIDRNYWNDRLTPPRGTSLYGGVQGHRGPMWWIKGYNNLKNLGEGENVYKEYVGGLEDFHYLRSIDDRGQTLSSPFKGTPQVNVATNGDEIEIKGNEYNKEWNIGSYRVGLFEDGLAVCLKNLSCTSLYTRQLTPVSVVTSTGTTSVVNEVTVETGSVGACSGHGTLTLQYHEVAAAGSSTGGSCYVLGVVGGGSSAPANASVITSIACATAVTNVSHTDTSVLRSTGTVSVYQAHGSGNHKFLESPASDGSTEIRFVDCPTSNCDEEGADAGV
jgi:hypothetical protein